MDLARSITSTLHKNPAKTFTKQHNNSQLAIDMPGYSTCLTKISQLISGGTCEIIPRFECIIGEQMGCLDASVFFGGFFAVISRTCDCDGLPVYPTTIVQ